MKCEKYRQQLTDLAYGEMVETPELREHLINCPECAAYYANLKEVQGILGTLPVPEESGFREVRRAVVKVQMLVERRKLIIDLVKFAGLIILVFTFYFAIYQWQGLKGFLGLYLALYLLFPFILIPLSKMRSQREGER